MQDMIVRETQRKQAIYDDLSRQLDKIVPRLIEKAKRKSAKGRPVDVEVSIRPYFGTISEHPLKNRIFAQGSYEAETKTRQWIVDEANRRLDEAGSPLRATFSPTMGTFVTALPNKVCAGIPNN